MEFSSYKTLSLLQLYSKITSPHMRTYLPVHKHTLAKIPTPNRLLQRTKYPSWRTSQSLYPRPKSAKRMLRRNGMLLEQKLRLTTMMISIAWTNIRKRRRPKRIRRNAPAPVNPLKPSQKVKLLHHL